MILSGQQPEDSSSSGDDCETNWDLLKETLGPEALAALREHMEEPSTIPLLPASIRTGICDLATSSVTIPKSNREYGKKEYWDNRFAQEKDFEWLVSYIDIKAQLNSFLTPESNILLVGCGNSSFSADLYDAGYSNILSLDYSPVVIQAMRKRHEHTRPDLQWIVMDMTHMDDLEDASFDIIIDKAAMDALMTAEGDVWNPNQSVIDASRRMCHHISRLLKVGGHHLHISFAQPHFRKKYLLGLHPKTTEEKCMDVENKDYSDEFCWSYKVETIGSDNSDGCFHHFLYILTKEPPK